MGKTNRIHNSGGRELDDAGVSDLESGEFNLPVSFMGNRGIRGFASEQGGIDSTKCQAEGLNKPKGEVTINGYTVFDEPLEVRTFIQFADALEAHSQYAVGGELGTAQSVSHLPGYKID
jgi:hypothetical protein